MLKTRIELLIALAKLETAATFPNMGTPKSTFVTEDGQLGVIVEDSSRPPTNVYVIVGSGRDMMDALFGRGAGTQKPS